MHIRHEWTEIDKRLDDWYDHEVTRFYYRCEKCGARKSSTLEGDWVEAER